MRPHTLCSFLLVLGLASSFALLPAGSARAEPAIAAGRPLLVQTALSHPNLPATPHTSYLKVGLVAGDARQERPLANVALVLDRSGSMMGEKLQRAKEAAKLAVERLRPDDVVAVVTYSDTVSVLVPATRAVAREAILDAIDSIGASGSTALFAGVSKGAEEVRRFYHPHRVNRIVLLSDGLANVGPSSPAALGSLGESLGREGIGVTTIGLGLDYNEDLMTQLAGRSEGNHFFAQTPEDLQRGFDLEFSIGLAVAMRDVRVAIRCAEGVRPVRLLSGTGDIVGQQVAVRLNQLYAGKEAVVLLELQTAFPEPRPAYPVASLVVTGSDLRSRSVARLEQQVQARTVADPQEVERSVDPTVMVEATVQLANLRYRAALDLRDQGKVAEARGLLQGNALFLKENAQRYKSRKLQQFEQSQQRSAGNMEGPAWKGERKRMMDEQLELSAPAVGF
ncbi:MAG: VWA domain-containing protein [Myxococcota bacterium]|jgi:Ca-activated chloride channel family protein|nr:VWA domain-containing protein [Myxococcota bacterium]